MDVNIRHNLGETKIDYVVGLESRGLIIGKMVADILKCGFIPARKAGKLPGPIHSEDYEKEYGIDTFSMQVKDLSGLNILLVDDIIATGGSFEAVIQIIKKFKGNVVGCLTLKEVESLRDIYLSKIKEKIIVAVP